MRSSMAMTTTWEGLGGGRNGAMAIAMS